MCPSGSLTLDSHVQKHSTLTRQPRFLPRTDHVSWQLNQSTLNTQPSTYEQRACLPAAPSFIMLDSTRSLLSSPSIRTATGHTSMHGFTFYCRGLHQPQQSISRQHTLICSSSHAHKFRGKQRYLYYYALTKHSQSTPQLFLERSRKDNAT